MTTSLIALLLVAATAVSCGSQSTTSPSSTTASSTTIAATTGPTTETFSSVLGIHGKSSHAFTVTAGGTISATLTSVGPPALAVGLGLGIPGAGPACSLAASITASVGASTQIAGTADAGRYCVQVYDLGTVTDPVAFAVTIEHP